MNPQDDCITELWLKQVAQALSKKFNVKVHKGKQWSADIEKGILTYGPEILLLNHNQALGLLTHEIAHLRETRAPKETPISKQFPALYHEGVNSIEDRRIEYIMGKEFPGAKEAIGLLNTYATDKVRNRQREITEQMLGAYDTLNEARIARGASPLPMGEVTRLMLTQNEVQTDTSEEAQVTLNEVTRCMPSRVPSVLTQVLIEACLQYEGHRPLEDNWNPDLVQQATKIADKMRSANVEQMKSTQEVADFWEKDIVPMVQQYFTRSQDTQQSYSQESASDEHGAKKTGTPEYRRGSMTERIRKEIDSMKEAEGQGAELSNDQDGFNYRVRTVELRDMIRANGYKLQRVLRDNMYDRKGGKHLSGILNTRKLYKHRMGNMRLFQRKIESDKKDFSFAIQCDTSGSMSGMNMYKTARDSMVLLNEVLAFCKIPTSVYAFSYTVRKAKGINQPTDPRTFSRVFSRAGGGTDMVGAYSKSVPELQELGRKNKIHICITDGAINRLEIDEIKHMMQKHKDITFYGIGIKVGLEELFKSTQCFKIDDIEELMPTLMGILKRHIIG
jgi:uncharacterized protein with von Willebrand factor type A (vWA) domain